MNRNFLTQAVLHHSVDEDGAIHRHWLEAERSRHKVGGEQIETKEEREDAIQRGKAVSRNFGIDAMGSRFNVLMTVQIRTDENIVSMEISDGNSR